MSTTHQLRWRRTATCASLALLLVITACSGDDDTSERGDAESTATTARVDVGASGDSTMQVPQDSDLDIQVRNPDGTRLTLSHIAFEGDHVLVDLEVFNGSPGVVDIHSTAGGDRALRLVDDAGNAYNFLVPPEEANAVFTSVEQGETLSGTFSFLGPLIGQPKQLRLVTNVAPDEIDGWSLDAEADRGVAFASTPGFVIPIDLTWA